MLFVAMEASFNWLDFIIFIPLIWFGYKGFSKGLVVEAASLIALGLGIYCTYHFSGWTADKLTDHLPSVSPKHMELISFGVTFIVVVILVHLIAKTIEKMINMVSLGFLNKLGGAVFGVAKVWMVLSVVLFYLNSWTLSGSLFSEEIKSGSLLFPYCSQTAEILLPKFKAVVHEGSETNDTINKAI